MCKYYIRYEIMGGQYYYMIYRQRLMLHSFFERWNTPESAITRLNELNDLSSSEHFRATAIFGHSELKTFFREEDDWLVFYGYRIDYDRNGVETGRTEPTATVKVACKVS